MLVNIILWLVFGGFVGWVAGMIMGNGENNSIVADIIIGLVGSVIGGVIAYYVTGNSITGISLWSFVWSLIGAVALIAVSRALTGARRAH